MINLLKLSNPYFINKIVKAILYFQMIIKNSSPVKKDASYKKNTKTQASTVIYNRYNPPQRLQYNTLPIRQKAKTKQQASNSQIQYQETHDDFTLPINSYQSIFRNQTIQEQKNKSNTIKQSPNKNNKKQLDALSMMVKKSNKIRHGKQLQKHSKYAENIKNCKNQTNSNVFIDNVTLHSPNHYISDKVLKDIITELKTQNTKLKKQLSKSKVNQIKLQTVKAQREEQELGKFLYLLCEKEQEIEDLTRKIKSMKIEYRKCVSTDINKKNQSNEETKITNIYNKSTQSLKYISSPMGKITSTPQYLQKMKDFYKQQLEKLQEQYQNLSDKYKTLQKECQLLQYLLQQKNKQIQNSNIAQILKRRDQSRINQNQNLAKQIKMLHQQLNHALLKLTQIQKENCQLAISYQKSQIEKLIMNEKLQYYESNIQIKEQQTKSNEKQQIQQYVQQVKQSFKLKQIKNEQYREIDQLSKIFEENFKT